MSHVLNFRNWYRLNEQTENLTGSTPDDLAALDRIQYLAEKGPTYWSSKENSVENAQPEKLITMVGTTTGTATGLGLATGQPYKVIEFKTSLDPLNPSAKKNTVKAVFFAQDGTLKATVWRNGVQLLSGDVKFKGHKSWVQLISIGTDSGFELGDMNGVELDASFTPAPICQGISSIIDNKRNTGMGEAVVFVPRGESNVKYSSDTSLLTNFVAAERAKAAPTQKP